jgi:nucleotide-binding universal stress UspA family protein
MTMTDDTTPRPAQSQDHAHGEVGFVVGVDGSPCSLKALQYAGDQAALTGSSLRVVTVFNGLPGYGFTAGLDQEGALSVVREALDAVGKKHPAVSTNGQTVYGVPGPVLAEVSEGAFALVVGTRGRGQIVGAVLGSVSEYVLHHAHCITTIVR